MNRSLDPLSLGHFSPILPRFFPIFSPSSPSDPQDSRNRHQDPEKRSETAAKRSRKGGLKPFNRKRRVCSKARAPTPRWLVSTDRTCLFLFSSIWVKWSEFSPRRRGTGAVAAEAPDTVGARLLRTRDARQRCFLDLTLANFSQKSECTAVPGSRNLRRRSRRRARRESSPVSPLLIYAFFCKEKKKKKRENLRVGPTVCTRARS